MKMKKLFSALCASAVLLSSIAGTTLAMRNDVYAEETTVEELAAEEQVLSAPQNLRVEDGYLVWDEVEDAYGYYLRFETDYVHQSTYYVCTVEVDRLCYDNNMDFGEYTFEVCAFKEDGTTSEWSEPVTAEYAPTLAAPLNVRLDEENKETVIWDEVDGAVRYNFRLYYDNEERTLYTNSYSYGGSLRYKWYLSESGNYWFSVQTMDRDYNVSAWTEPIKISHTKTELEIPQNVRLDETGENILWDEVAGADKYEVLLSSNKDTDGNDNRINLWIDTDRAKLENWKTYVCPSAEEYKISVHAYNSASETYSGYSDELTVPNNFTFDNTIELPENLTVESDAIRFETDSNIKTYWMIVYANNKPFENQTSYWFIKDYNWGTEGYSAEISNYIYNRYPEGNYDIKILGVDGNNKYNVKTYSVTFDTPHDSTVWVPDVFYKFDTLLWDYDRLRHDTTDFFWIRIKNANDDSIIDFNWSWTEYFYGLSEMPNGEYIFETCVYDYTGKLGPWSTPLKILKHDGGLFDKENETTTEVETPPEAADIPEADRVTSITINPAFNMKHKDGDDVELDLSKIKIKAKEIYDEEGLQRASEALGETISGNKHYNLLDLTLLYNEEDFSNGYDGLVQVIIPIPAGHRDKTFSCYRLTEVNGKMTKELIPGEQTEDSYIIYLEHFSEYALVGDGGESDHTHAYGDDWKSDKDSHWKECECGSKTENAAHIFGEWKVTKEATKSDEGSKERVCNTCSFKQTEALPKLTPSTPDKPSTPDVPSASSAPEVSESSPAVSNTTSSEPTSYDTMTGESASSDSTTSGAPTASDNNPSTGVAAVSVLPIAAIVSAVVIITKKKK